MSSQRFVAVLLVVVLLVCVIQPAAGLLSEQEANDALWNSVFGMATAAKRVEVEQNRPMVWGRRHLPIPKESDPDYWGDTKSDRKLSPSIVGGSSVSISTYPYMVQLAGMNSSSANYYFQCGASWIHQYWMMTAAHCVTSSTTGATFDAVLTKVYWGSATYCYGCTKGVYRVVVNSAFNAITFQTTFDQQDIALLQVYSNWYTDAVAAGSSVSLLALNINTDCTLTGVACRVTGWGKTSGSGSVSSTLLGITSSYSTVAVSTGSTCVTGAGTLSANQAAYFICVSGTGVDTCEGDSGGPVINVLGNGTFQQVGIVSWGASSCTGPGMFTNVLNQKTWISTQQSTYGTPPAAGSTLAPFILTGLLAAAAWLFV